MNLTEFYPTPIVLSNKMLEGIDFINIKTILEPSAGTGNLVEAIITKTTTENRKYHFHYDKFKMDIDTIELDRELNHILIGKEYRVVHDDFLTFDSLKRYDLIIMNPPFSNGDEHLLKALEIQEGGGQVICLLNAETLKNPFTNRRKDLVQKLEELTADIQYMEGEFTSAERKTNVEIALIKVNIPKKYSGNILLGELELQKAKSYSEQKHQENALIHGDFIVGMVESFNYEAKAGMTLLKEYASMQHLIMDSLKGEYNKPIIELKVNGNSDYHEVNTYLKKLRYKYWDALFQSGQLTKHLTTNLQNELHSKVNELVDYDFSLYNISRLRSEMNKHILGGLHETILALFDEFSRKHYYDESSKNIHYYNGWKTNKSWKINKKVIIPLNAFRSWSNNAYDPDHYEVIRKLTDIEKALNYLDCGRSDHNHVYLENALSQAERCSKTSKIITKYFLITFYKKGTCHLEFLNEDLLKKFNLYGSQRKGWLPPGYGKKSYYDMNSEERAVVNEFEGMASYAQTVKNKEYFLVEDNQLLLSMSQTD